MVRIPQLLLGRMSTSYSLRDELLGKQLPVQVVALLKDILGILDFIHSYGVIHRDIKPSNIIRR